jgi:putative transcriptional regulator
MTGKRSVLMGPVVAGILTGLAALVSSWTLRNVSLATGPRFLLALVPAPFFAGFILVELRAVDCRSAVSPRQRRGMKNRLRVLRAERNWTQADLAKRLGVARQTINVIENGHYDPSLTLAFDIAALFRLRIEDVFERGTGK